MVSSSIKKDHRLSILFFTIFLDMLGLSIIIPILPSLLIRGDIMLGASIALPQRLIILGLVLAAYPFAQFFGAPILGGLADRIGRKKVLLVSLAGTLAGYLLAAIAVLNGNLWLFVASRFIDGFTGGNITVAYASIADISTKESKTRNFGMIGMAFGLGFILGPFIGGVLGDASIVPWFGFATPFWFAAVLAAANILFVAWKFQETLTTPSTARVSATTGLRNIAKAMRHPRLGRLFLVAFLLAFGFNFFTQFFQVFLIERFTYSTSQVGLLFAYIGLTIALVQGIVVRPVSRRWQPTRVVKVSALLLALTLPLLLLPGKAVWLFAILPFVSLFNGLTYPNLKTILSENADAASQGELFGISQSIESLTMMIPPVIAGFVAALHVSLPILVAAGSVGLAWFIFCCGDRRKRLAKFHTT